MNLLPAQRGRGLNISVSAPYAGLCGGLALALVGTVLYVSEHNHVDSKQVELNQLNTSVAHWDATASTYSRFTVEAQQHAQQFSDIGQLVAARFDWSNLLGEIAGLMPGNAQLTSLQASSPLAVPFATETTTVPPSSALQLSGCAASQSAVAETMIRLHRVSGVSSVVLSSATGAATTGSTATQSCSFPVQFSLSLNFGSGATAGTGMASSAPDDSTAATS